MSLKTFPARSVAVAMGKILIVGGDADFRLNVREFLQIHGYEVREAESCRATLS
jgi:PleD family two-component response regulator